MPRRCVAAGCSTSTGEGYSLHEFPRDDSTRAKWTQAVKRFRGNWDGPSVSSVLCSKHFEPECFVVEASVTVTPWGFQLNVGSTLVPSIPYFRGPPTAKAGLAFHAKGQPSRNVKDKR